MIYRIDAYQSAPETSNHNYIVAGSLGHHLGQLKIMVSDCSPNLTLQLDRCCDIQASFRDLIITSTFGTHNPPLSEL